MSKRWVARPRGIRWLAGGIVAVVLAAVVAWALFVPAADWLARHDVGSVKGPLHETAVDNARGRLLALGAGLLAAGALIFTARNFTVSRRTFELTEQGQVTERYTRAVEQLGSDKLDVRIGSIYALERVARDSARDHPTIMEVLTAFIREHSREQWPLLGAEGAKPEQSTRPDVAAALTVIVRRDTRRYLRRIDLTGAKLTHTNLSYADLTGASLTDANLSYADLTGADLTGADLTRANLTRANLSDANLTRASLTGADLTGADLTGADLTHANIGTIFTRLTTGADLTGPNFTAAILKGADLTGAYLMRANLTGADLTGADLTDADLTDANLTNANLSYVRMRNHSTIFTRLTGAALTGPNFTGADLTGATWSVNTPVPDGWKLNAGSGRLERAGGDSKPTEAN